MTLRYFHFSIDDVIDCLLEVAEQPNTFWDQQLLRFVAELHRQYGMNVDLYLFLERYTPAGANTLERVPAELKQTVASLHWLRWGPHARNTETAPHTQSVEEQLQLLAATYRHIDRFAGHERVSPWVRLHYFSESFELAGEFQAHGVSTLLTTDKPALCYRLPAECREQLSMQGRTHYRGIDFRRSHIRIESLLERQWSDAELHQELRGRVGQSDCAVIFTHEYELVRPEVRQMTKRVLDWVRSLGLQPL